MSDHGQPERSKRPPAGSLGSSADDALIAPLTREMLDSAYTRISSVLPPTPLTFSPILSEIAGREIFIKWDNRQRTGSFKERGAVNFLQLLPAEKRMRGVCAASAGNHALALSYHAAKMSIPCTIVMPLSAPLIKVQSTQKTGASVILHGSNFDEAYEYAQDIAAEKHLEFVSAFDDTRIIAGQASAGLEILDQLADFDSVIVPIGGGGLVSGVAAALRLHKPDVFVLGVTSEWAQEMRKLAQIGTVSPFRAATIADGIAVKREGKITGPLIKRLVNNVIAVSENQIAHAIVRLLETERIVVEGAGAAGVAGLFSQQLPSHLKRTVILVCGSNIDINVLARLIEREMAERGRLLRIQISVPDRPGMLHASTGLIAQTGANIMQVHHDRSLSIAPGNVAITFLIEVRDIDHKSQVIEAVRSAGIEMMIVSA